MRKQSWTKRDPIKNYFPLPNEIYDLGLSRGAISVYSFLLRQEDRKTYQCLLSYTHVTPDMQRAASDVVGGFLKNLLGEELNPWQGNEKAEPAP